MNDKYKINVEKLKALNLYQLREVGSKIGVRNPTQLKADELRQAIVDVVSGKVKPYLKVKSGRPHKKELIPDTEWNKVIGYDSAAFNDDSALFSIEGSQLKQARDNIYVGFVKELNNKMYFFADSFQKIRMSNFAVVSETALNYNMLRSGDKVKCGILFQEKTPIVLEIYEINGKDPCAIRQIFDCMQNEFTQEQINFSLPQLNFINENCPFSIGQRMMITGENTSGQTYLCNSIAKDLDSKFKVVYFSVCKRPEEKISLSNDCEYYFTSFEALPRDINFYFEIIPDRVRRLCELGCNVILIIDDIITLMLNLRDLLIEKSNNAEMYYDEILQNFKNLFSYSKNTKNGSLSIICSAYTDCHIQKFNEYSIILDRLCNCHIKLNKMDYIKGKKDFFDPQNTYTEVIRQV